LPLAREPESILPQHCSQGPWKKICQERSAMSSKKIGCGVPSAAREAPFRPRRLDRLPTPHPARPAATKAPRCRRLSRHKRPGLAHDPALHRSSAPPEPCNARSRAEARSVFGTLLMLVQAPAAPTEGSRLVGAGRLQFNACLPQLQRECPMPRAYPSAM
jgi:hypothetical protein